ncbi:MAG: hypothetical protein KJN71_04680 [Acidimicrobiia bacterium]|nr:hypothetical protein [Acidimicrobiia bacterium]NNC74137.1 hypothetical protein [Acidimicrobiia bacterium]
MEDFPKTVADYLESTAQKVREMTVDRVAGWARWAALGMVMAVLALMGVVFLLIGLFRILAEVVQSPTIAYAILGAIFAVVGAFVWSKRNHPKE